MLTVPVLIRLPLNVELAVPAFQVPPLPNVEVATFEPVTLTLPLSVPLLAMVNVPLVLPNTALVAPVTVELLVIAILPEVAVALIALPPVDVNATPVVIVVEPVVAKVSIALPLTLPTVPPVSETITLPPPVISALTALVVPLSAPPVWPMSMVPLPVARIPDRSGGNRAGGVIDVDQPAAASDRQNTVTASRHVVTDIDGIGAVYRAGRDASSQSCR